jgi:hypothetical protein
VPYLGPVVTRIDTALIPLIGDEHRAGVDQLSPDVGPRPVRAWAPRETGSLILDERLSCRLH